MSLVRRVFVDQWPKPADGVGFWAVVLCYGVPFGLVGLGMPAAEVAKWMGMSKDGVSFVAFLFVMLGCGWFWLAWIKVQKWH